METETEDDGHSSCSAGSGLTAGSDIWTWMVLNVLKVPTDVAYSNSHPPPAPSLSPSTPPPYRRVRSQQKHVSDHAAQTWKKKMAIRTGAGLAMAALLSMVVAAGHLAVCIMVVAVQFAIFGELVSLRFNQAKTKAIEGPMFRTVQWGWFCSAMVDSYSSSWLKAPLGAQKYLVQLHHWSQQHSGPSGHSGHSGHSGDAAATASLGASPEAVVGAVAVAMYSAMLVVTVLSLAPGVYQQQIGQLSWTGFVVVAVVFQLKVAVYSIYSGLYFLLFPASLVVANDTFAYFCGMSMGKKIVNRPFMALSPSKTWEGFAGAFVLTMWYAYSTANLWGGSPWMRCSFPELADAAAASRLERGADAATSMLPTHCAADKYFTADDDGDEGGGGSMSRAQAVGIGLALFASLIAPFGGFFASAVKRATSVKDFASYIPGHGGFTDRMDCQLIMAVAAWAAFALCMPRAASQVGNFKFDAAAGVFVNGSI